MDKNNDKHETAAAPRHPDIGWVARATSIVLLILGLAATLWYLRQLVFLTFAGILIAVVISHLAVKLRKHLPMPRLLSLGIVVGLIILAVTTLIMATGPQIVGQFDTLAQRLPGALQSLEDYLDSSRIGTYMLNRIEEPEQSGNWNALGLITGTFSTVMNVVANIFVVIAVALFLATNPDIYRKGAMLLVPDRMQPRATQFLDTVSPGLFHWLLGQLVAMAVVAVLMALGLWWLGMPVYIALGVIAGLTNFIPYFGPFIGGIPAMLIAFSIDPTKAFWVGLLIFLVQVFEGNFLTPNIQKQATSLPPALIVVTIVGFGMLFGLLGMMFATPILLVIVVAVHIFYIEGMLNKTAPPPQ